VRYVGGWCAVVYTLCQLVMMASCARHSCTRRLHCVNLGEKVPAPSASSISGVFTFTKSNITVTPRNDVIEHSPDDGAVYLSVYRRFRDAAASRRPPPTQPMGERRSRCRMRLGSLAGRARSGTRVTCPCDIG